jgi:FkbM family methyltransferase
VAELSTRSKIALARAARGIVSAGRRVCGATDRAEVTRGGIRWDLDLGEGIDFAIYLMGGFELRTLRLYRSLVQPGWVVLDVGANIGAHTLPLAELVGPTGRVVAFEPTRFAFDKLSRNLLLNAGLATRVAPLQMALLGSAEERVPDTIYSSWPLEGGGSSAAQGELHEVHGGRLCSTEGARAAMLDEVVASLGLGRWDFMKLDVDGHEPAVIRGAARSLARFRPTILMEWAPSCFEGMDDAVEEALGVLRGCGYTFTPVGSTRPFELTRASLASVVQPGASRNLLLSAPR